MHMFSRLACWVRRPAYYLPLVLCVALVTGIWSLLPAELVAPRPNDRHITNMVTSLVLKEHLTKHPLDDEISRRGFKSFLRTLDPMKLYFYQADVDEFAKFQDRLDDMLQIKDISFAYAVFQRFSVRVDERIKLVDELLKQEFDFTKPDAMITDPEKLQYAKTPEESRQRWERRLKYDLLVLKGDKKEGQAARDKLHQRYHSLAKRLRQTDADELLEMFLTAMTTGYDPHTTYMSPSSLENFRIVMRLNLEGIGAALQVEDGYTMVSKIIPGGAADKQGKLRPKDRIVSVGQNDSGDIVDVVDMKLNDVVAMIRGRAGTVVRLGVIPAGSNETKVYAITRAKIELKDSEAHGEVMEQPPRTDPAKEPPAPDPSAGQSAQPNLSGDARPMRIGVLDLPSFYMDMEGAGNGLDEYKSTTRDVRRILQEFEAKRTDAVVLDLRHNGGGSLTEAISLTGLFIDTGAVVQVKGSDGHVQQYDDTERGMAWKGPLVVVTSKFSASASEILAGAIQDYHRGLIVGDTSTHGKGTVQSLLDLGRQTFRSIPNPPNLGALKITMQQFYRPNGDSTQKRGVLSDIRLPSITDHMDVAEADLDYAVEFDRLPSARYSRFNMVSPDVVQTLTTRSQTRLGKVPEFTKLLRNIERYKAQKAKKMVNLKADEYFAERAEIDAEKEEEKQLEDPTQKNEQTIKRDYYLNEVLAITADYVRLLQAGRVARAQ